MGPGRREANRRRRPGRCSVCPDREELASKQAPLLWSGNWKENAAEMIHEDLDKAGITYRDSAGLFFDFHALRHQFLTTLARSGTHPKETQILARHSTIDLTMDRYTHLGLVDLTGALDRLPGLPGQADIEPERATGTEGGSTAAGSQPDPRSAVQGAQDSGPKGKKEADGNRGPSAPLTVQLTGKSGFSRPEPSSPGTEVRGNRGFDQHRKPAADEELAQNQGLPARSVNGIPWLMDLELSAMNPPISRGLLTSLSSRRLWLS